MGEKIFRFPLDNLTQWVYTEFKSEGNEMTRIEAAEMMTAKINEMNAFAKARVWIGTGVDFKVRVYLEKGFVEIKANDKANIETVGRNYFDAAKAALVATGYARTYA